MLSENCAKHLNKSCTKTFLCPELMSKIGRRFFAGKIKDLQKEFYSRGDHSLRFYDGSVEVQCLYVKRLHGFASFFVPAVHELYMLSL